MSDELRKSARVFVANQDEIITKTKQILENKLMKCNPRLPNVISTIGMFGHQTESSTFTYLRQ